MFDETTAHQVEIQYFNITVTENGDILPEYNDPMLKDIMVFDPEAPGQLRPRLVSANRRIDELNARYENTNNRLSYLSSQVAQQKNQLEELIKDNFDDLGKHLAEDLANIFNVEMKKTVEFKATIEVKGEIEVDFWTDSEDYFEDVDFDVDFGWGSEGSIVRTDIAEIEEI
jgi:uncharacterized coiled-coil protein SlyX